MKTLQKLLDNKIEIEKQGTKILEIIPRHEYDDEESEKIEGGKADLSGLVNLKKFKFWRSHLNSPITELILGNNLELTYLSLQDNQLTTLDLSQCPNLTSLDLSGNQLTSIKFLKTLPHPENLKELDLSNNNIEKTNLEFLRPFVSLEKLRLGSYLTETNAENYNRFYGSLEPLWEMTKLSRLEIINTDIDRGLEYLFDSVRDLICFENSRKDAKVNLIAEELKKYRNDRDSNRALLISWKEKHYYLLTRALWEKIDKLQTKCEDAKVIKKWQEAKIKELTETMNKEIAGLKSSNEKLQSQIQVLPK